MAGWVAAAADGLPGLSPICRDARLALGVRSGHSARVSDNRWRATDDYMSVIDALVNECTNGQGTIGPRRVRAGVWNENATPDHLPEQHRVNLLLGSLTDEQRDVLAGVLNEQFTSGVFIALRVLHEAGIEPFDDGVEGTPFNDFVGRLAGWPWPRG